MPDKSKKNKFIPGRSFFLIAACMIFCAVIAFRLFYLQVVSYDKYQNDVISNIQAVTTEKPERGIIYDRNMVKLAMNSTVYRIFISPRDITDVKMASFISSKLSEILGVDYQMVYDNTQKVNEKTQLKYADRTIQKNVSEETADLVRDLISENGLQKQIHLEPYTVRYYPFGSLASHVLGFVGTDGGLLGLELYYNKYMTGVPGRYITAKDAHGQKLSAKYESYVETQNGADLITAIDNKIQDMLENELEKTFNESQAQNRVTGIVMDVNTGAIYAMATYPDFDLNSPYTLDMSSREYLNSLNLIPESSEYNTEYMTLLYKMWNNKAVSYLYEPGSTFKIMTSAMAIEEKAIAWDQEINCIGYHTVSGRSIGCHRTWGHGKLSFMRGLQQSCNPALMIAAENLGRDLFYKYFEAFGYTEKTGIDLPGEAEALYSSFSNFKALELAVYSFGQTFKVTPIQQLTAIAAVANGGYLVVPHVVSQIVDNNGSIIFSNEKTVKRQVISADVCRQVTETLEQGVSTDGGAKNAYVAGYKIAAKTGTSEIRDILNEEGESYLRIGSCVGYAPSDDPQIACLIIVDRPQGENIFGSYVAAPYIASFFSQALPYMGIQRNYTAEEQENLAVILRNYIGLSLTEVSADLTNRKVSFKVEGAGETVTYQVPAGGSSISKDSGRVVIYTGDAKPDEYVTVPDVIGRTANKAKSEIINLGLNIMLEGSANLTAGDGAIVISQEPAAGTSVERGTVITVVMRHIGDTDA